MPESNILDVESKYSIDSKITKLEYHSYVPYTSTFDNNNEIRIAVQQTDVYPYLHESFLFIEGKVTDSIKVKLYNNGLSFLFDQIMLEINVVEVDKSRILNVACSLKGYISSTPDNYNCYENAGWNFKHNTDISNDSGEFTACVPLKYWLGFFEDFKKILINCRLELVLTRSNNSLNYLKTKTSGSATSGGVNVSRLIWKIPHVSVDDTERLKLTKIVEKEKSIFIPFRSYDSFEYPELGNTKQITWNLKTASKLENHVML